MSDSAFYPVTGDGETLATAYSWNTGTISFNTPSFWAAVSSFETLDIGITITTGTVPGGGDNIGLIAGAIDPIAFSFYTPDPARTGCAPPVVTGPAFETVRRLVAARAVVLRRRRRGGKIAV